MKGEILRWVGATFVALVMIAVLFGFRSDRDLSGWVVIAGLCLGASVAVALSRVIPPTLGITTDAVSNVVLVGALVGVFAFVTDVGIWSWLFFYLPASIVAGLVGGGWVSHREAARESGAD